jgi:hypothetical protein
MEGPDVHAPLSEGKLLIADNNLIDVGTFRE